MADNPFDITGAPAESDSDISRRRKLQSLQGLFKQPGEQSDVASLEEQPLYGGQINKSVSTEASQPSELATERVERAPASQEASPLLAPEERLGNVLTGEEGSYGPLTGEQRSVSLRSLFPGIARGSEEQAASAGAPNQTSRNVGGAEQGDDQAAGPPAGLKELGYAKQGLSYADILDKATGGKANDYLKNLFTSGGMAGAFPANRATFASEFQGGETPNFSMTGEPTETGGLGYQGSEAPAGSTGAGSIAGTGASVLGLIAGIWVSVRSGSDTRDDYQLDAKRYHYRPASSESGGEHGC